MSIGSDLISLDDPISKNDLVCHVELRGMALSLGGQGVPHDPGGLLDVLCVPHALDGLLGAPCVPRAPGGLLGALNDIPDVQYAQGALRALLSARKRVLRAR
jgi:hypothetical protein